MLSAEKVFVRSDQRVAAKAAGALGFTVLLCFAAYLKIPLPFTPVPITFQNVVVLAAGATLGSAWGAGSVALYLFLGAIGIPLFANSGAGLSYLAGPTGGYLLGFLVASWIAGYARQRVASGGPAAFFGLMVLGMSAIYLCGALWLRFFFSWGSQKIWALGVAPFLAVDLAKALAAAFVVGKLASKRS